MHVNGLSNTDSASTQLIYTHAINNANVIRTDWCEAAHVNT